MTSGSFGRSGTQSTPPQAGVSMTSQLTSQMEMSPGDLGSLLVELHDVQETQNEILQEVQNFKVSGRLRPFLNPFSPSQIGFVDVQIFSV